MIIVLHQQILTQFLRGTKLQHGLGIRCTNTCSKTLCRNCPQLQNCQMRILFQKIFPLHVAVKIQWVALVCRLFTDV